MTGPPLIGELSITTADGTELTAPTDVRLAWLWAEHEQGATWAGLTYGQRCREVADALAELRRSAAAAG